MPQYLKKCTKQTHMGFPRKEELVTSLAKEAMFLVALVCLFVCLSVCLSVDNFTQKVMNGLG